MTLTPEELLTLLASVAQKEPRTKGLTSALNGMIIQARLVASSPALRARAAREMAGLEHAVRRLEAAMKEHG